MIDKLEIYPIPFVDGIPAFGQQSVEWIKNGECPTGATRLDANDGTLNRTGVQIQTNVATMSLNSDEQVTKINELVDSVNIINDNLEHIADKSLIAQVNTNTSNLAIVGNTVVDHTQQIRVLDTARLQTDAIIGTRNPSETLNRTMLDESYWQKTEMGSYPGFDINGQVDPGAIGTGMKYRIMSNETTIRSNEARIQTLEQNWKASQVGELTEDVAQLRAELGPTLQADVTKTVYTRLDDSQAAIRTIGESIDAIHTAINFVNVKSVNERVLVVETVSNNNASLIGDDDSGLISEVNEINATLGNDAIPGTVCSRVKDTERRTGEIEGVLGVSSSDGLRGAVATLTASVGDSTTENTIAYKVTLHDNSINTLQTNTQQLVNTVGNSTGGLVGATAHLARDVYGDPTATDPVQQKGILTATQELSAEMPTKITDVVDDQYYVRTNGRWVAIPSAKGVFKKDVTVAIVKDTPVQISMADATNDSFVPVQIDVEDGNLMIRDEGDFNILSHFFVKKTTAGLYSLQLKINDVIAATQSRYLTAGDEAMFIVDTIASLTGGVSKVEATITGLNDESVGNVEVSAAISVIHV